MKELKETCNPVSLVYMFSSATLKERILNFEAGNLVELRIAAATMRLSSLLILKKSTVWWMKEDIKVDIANKTLKM